MLSSNATSSLLLWGRRCCTIVGAGIMRTQRVGVGRRMVDPHSRRNTVTLEFHDVLPRLRQTTVSSPVPDTEDLAWNLTSYKCYVTAIKLVNQIGKSTSVDWLFGRVYPEGLISMTAADDLSLSHMTSVTRPIIVNRGLCDGPRDVASVA